MADELKVPLGVREDGSIIHITEVPIEENGLKCKCVCPKCGDRLQARKLTSPVVVYEGPAA